MAVAGGHQEQPVARRSPLPPPRCASRPCGISSTADRRWRPGSRPPRASVPPCASAALHRRRRSRLDALLEAFEALRPQAGRSADAVSRAHGAAVRSGARLVASCARRRARRQGRCDQRLHATFKARIDLGVLARDHAAASGQGRILNQAPCALLAGGARRSRDDRRVLRMQVDADLACAHRQLLEACRAPSRSSGQGPPAARVAPAVVPTARASCDSCRSTSVSSSLEGLGQLPLGRHRVGDARVELADSRLGFLLCTGQARGVAARRLLRGRASVAAASPAARAHARHPATGPSTCGSDQRCGRRRPRGRVLQTYSSPLPPSAIVPASASLRALCRISFCAASTSASSHRALGLQVVLEHSRPRAATCS